MMTNNIKNYDFRQALIDQIQNKWVEYLLAFVVGLAFGWGVLYLTTKWALPNSVKKELQILELEKEKVLKSKLPPGITATYLNKIETEKKQILKNYPSIIWIGNISRTGYVKWKLLIGYIASGIVSIIPLIGLTFYYRKKIKPVVFPEPYIEIPFNLGKPKELLDFDLIGIDKEKFKNLFNNEKDYELFWKILNGNLIIKEGVYSEVVKSYMKNLLKNSLEFQGMEINSLTHLNWDWSKSLKPFREKLGKYKEMYTRLQVFRLPLKKSKWDIEIQFPKDYYTVPSYQVLNQEAYETLYILSTYKDYLLFPRQFTRIAKAEKGKLNRRFWILFAKIGAYDIEDISLTIRKIISELENWSRFVGVELDENFRERMALAIMLEIIPNFIRENNIPKGLANRFLKDEIVKFVNSYLSSGLLIKARTPLQKQARDYLLLFHTYKVLPWEISLMDYLNLKYNIVFDIEQEEIAQKLKEKIGIYEDYLIWN